MIAIFDLIALGVLALIAFGVWKSLRAPRQYIGAPSTPEGAKVPLSDPSPVKFAALLRRASENTRAKLQDRYPAVFAMRGGYLNSRMAAENGGVEGAVNEVIAAWR